MVPAPGSTSADKLYSNYLRKELIDEVHGIIPDIGKILTIFSETRKWILSISEFRKAYEERVQAGAGGCSKDKRCRHGPEDIILLFDHR
jgi:hypothetical protein